MASSREEPVTIAECTSSDVDEVVALFAASSGREIDGARIARNIGLFPAFVARDAEQRLLGFVFSVDFAPDVLELANIYVVPSHRSRGLGGQLAELIEGAARGLGFGWMILVNSLLYTTNEPKRPATEFYARRGYEVVLDTGPSKVFVKQL